MAELTDPPRTKRTDFASEEHEQSLEELTAENTRWLKVVAYIAGSMAGLDENEIYEDIE